MSYSLPGIGVSGESIWLVSFYPKFIGILAIFLGEPTSYLSYIIFEIKSLLSPEVNGVLIGVDEPNNSLLSFSSSILSLSSLSSFDSFVVFMNLYILSKIPKPAEAASYILVWGFSFSFSL